MSVFKRGGVYWYEFVFKGERIRESTHQPNQNVARQMESAHRTALAKGEVGIAERRRAPTLQQFAGRFMEATEVQCAEKPATISFYREKLRRLLEYGPFVKRPIDQIDEALIDAYKQDRSKRVSRYGRRLSPASMNRELATLRKMLRLAQEWKVIDRVPRIRMLRGERIREFVLTHHLERIYLANAHQPLRDIAILILGTGLRLGEARRVRIEQVHLQPAANSKYGRLHIPGGGKSPYAKRVVSLTPEVNEMLSRHLATNKNGWMFPGRDPRGPMHGTSIDHQHKRLREKLKLPEDFVIHSLRHTMLTRLGESGADAFTIMRIAGHSSVTVSQRYVHPSPEAQERAFERLQALNERATARVEAESGNRLSEAEGVPTKVPTVDLATLPTATQVAENKVTGP
jgi:integrase